MAENLTPEDRLMWARCAPHASYWLCVSDTHPFIHGHYQPTPTGSLTRPPTGSSTRPPTGSSTRPPTGPPTGPHTGLQTGPPPPYVLPPPYFPYHPELPVQGLSQAAFHPHPGLMVPVSVAGGGCHAFHLFPSNSTMSEAPVPLHIQIMTFSLSFTFLSLSS